MRKLTIGVTVNLKNYESLRLEVSDEVEGEEGAQELAQFLDHTLALFGRENPETAELVGQYRRRVLGGLATASGGEDGTPAAAPQFAPKPPAADAPAPVRAAPGPTPAAPPDPGTVPTAKGAGSPGGNTPPATATPVAKAPPTPGVKETLSFTPASRVTRRDAGTGIDGNARCEADGTPTPQRKGGAGTRITPRPGGRTPRRADDESGARGGTRSRCPPWPKGGDCRRTASGDHHSRRRAVGTGDEQGAGNDPGPEACREGAGPIAHGSRLRGLRGAGDRGRGEGEPALRFPDPLQALPPEDLGDPDRARETPAAQVGRDPLP